MTQSTDTDQAQQWAIMELMGHQKIAGRYTEHGAMHRVDVPDGNGRFRFSRLYSPQAIYSITFVDLETAQAAAQVFDQPAITVWELQTEIKRLAAAVPASYPDEIYDLDYTKEDEQEFYPPNNCLNCGGGCDGDYCSIICQEEYTREE